MNKLSRTPTEDSNTVVRAEVATIASAEARVQVLERERQVGGRKAIQGAVDEGVRLAEENAPTPFDELLHSLHSIKPWLELLDKYGKTGTARKRD